MHMVMGNPLRWCTAHVREEIKVMPLPIHPPSGGQPIAPSREEEDEEEDKRRDRTRSRRHRVRAKITPE